VFADKGVCYDCHSADATGNIDYGAPSLRGPTWLYGGDRAALTQSVRDGRHGLCPAWIGRLRPAQIRALAIFLSLASRAQPPRPQASPAQTSQAQASQARAPQAWASQAWASQAWASRPGALLVALRSP